jgi:2-oxoglutarate ferredoxin oxidoreductase subunit alpha
MHKERTVFLQGNEAVSEGAIAAGVRFFAGYPITPATEIAEYMSERMPEVDGTFLQMEDEIGGISAVLGASCGGVKAMTASSGPGLSLKAESIGYAVCAEVPCFIVNVQRTGPGVGSVTTSQQDVMQAKWGPHSDNMIISLAPASIKECFWLAIRGVNLSEKYRIPVIMLSDSYLGHMYEKIDLPDSEGIEILDRPKPTVPPSKYKTYDADINGVPPLANVGEGYAIRLVGNMHNKAGDYSRDPKDFDFLIHRLHNKILTNLPDVQSYEEVETEDADWVIVAYGITSRAAKAAVRLARAEGLRVGLFRPITIWPFPAARVAEIGRRVEGFLVAEMNLGQIIGEVERATRHEVPVAGVNRVDGLLINPLQILAKVKEMFQCQKSPR